MARESNPKIVTKKHLARLERERRQKRFIILGSAVVVVIAVGAVLFGILDQAVFTPAKTVAEVNDAKISVREFQARTRYIRQNIIQQYLQTYSFAQAFGSDPNTQQYFTSQLQQLELQLEPVSLGQQILDVMVQEELVLQEAERRGITVSDEEIDAVVQESFNFFPNGTPTPAPTAGATTVPPTLSPTQLSLVTATPTLTPTLTATPVLTPTATAEPTEAPTATVEATQVLTPTLTPTPYTQELYEQDYEEYIDGLAEGVNISEAEFRHIVEMQLLREKVTKAVEADLPHEQQEVWLRQIVTADEAAALAALDRINAGQDFGTVASEVSTDSPSAVAGGDIGWQTAERLDPAVAEIAFGKEVGEVAGPVETANGWAIIQVLGNNTKNLSDAEYEELQTLKFNEWLTEQREASEVQINDFWTEIVPTRPVIPPEYRPTQS